MMELYSAVKAIGIMAAVTIGLRAIPFLGAAHLDRFPLLLRMGHFLPPAIMTLLLLHAVRGSMAEHTLGMWPDILAAAVAIALQWYGRQPLLSIAVATGLYVAIRNMLA